MREVMGPHPEVGADDVDCPICGMPEGTGDCPRCQDKQAKERYRANLSEQRSPAAPRKNSLNEAPPMTKEQFDESIRQLKEKLNKKAS